MIISAVRMATALGLMCVAATPAGAGQPDVNPADSTRTVWVHITGGTFRMGSEVATDDAKPMHEVTVADFDIAKTEATVRQYQACVDAGACTVPHWDDGTCHVLVPGSSGPGNLPAAYREADLPVVCVDWLQATAFAAWAGGRLCTEAEWEYAARSGGKERKCPWGNEEPTCQRAVMNQTEQPGCGKSVTSLACSKAEGNTEQGVCDMLGNVSEMVDDWYRPYTEAARPTAEGPMVGDVRVFRGGGLFDSAWRVNAHVRRRLGPTRSASDRGIRICN